MSGDGGVRAGYHASDFDHALRLGQSLSWRVPAVDGRDQTTAALAVCIACVRSRAWDGGPRCRLPGTGAYLIRPGSQSTSGGKPIISPMTRKFRPTKGKAAR